MIQMDSPFSVTAAGVLCDNLPWAYNFVRCLNKELRSALPSAKGRATDVRILDLQPGVVEWIAAAMSPGDRTKLISMLVVDGNVGGVRAMKKFTEITGNMCSLCVKTGTLEMAKTIRAMSDEWSDTLASAVAISRSRFDVLDWLGTASPDMYVYAASAGNEEAVDWLRSRGVDVPPKLAVFAAHHGHARLVKSMITCGIGGCPASAFNVACAKGDLGVLEAMWEVGYFSHAVYEAAFKRGDVDMYKWACGKVSMKLDQRMLMLSLMAVCGRDDLHMFKILHEKYPYHAITPPVLSAAGDGDIACYVRGILH